MLLITGWVLLMVSWFAWAYPFIFRAPHNQRRPSITVIGATRAGLALECIGISIAFACRLSGDQTPSDNGGSSPRSSPVRVAAVLSWSAVKHLGRQFRVHAGLYEDHQLVTTGPYAIVRHPIYSSLLAILASTLFLLTPWQCAAASRRRRAESPPMWSA